MSPRPLYKWKSFWFGVLVLAFLGWAWGWSRRHIDGVLWFEETFSISAGQTTGRSSLAWDGSQDFGYKDFVWIHEPAQRVGEPLFPMALIWETYPRQFQLTVAHWFLILLFLVPWSGWLAWSCRRLKRIGNPIDASG